MSELPEVQAYLDWRDEESARHRFHPVVDEAIAALEQRVKGLERAVDFGATVFSAGADWMQRAEKAEARVKHLEDEAHLSDIAFDVQKLETEKVEWIAKESAIKAATLVRLLNPTGMRDYSNEQWAAQWLRDLAARYVAEHPKEQP